MKKTNEKVVVVVVGAGLVGCLASMYLSKLGFNVIVYEYRDDIRKNCQKAGKSINLALSHRGLKALKNAGIQWDRIARMLVPMKGRMIHKRNAQPEALLYDVKYHQTIYSVGRNDLNKMLLDEAEKVVEFHFGCKVEQVDFRRKMLKISRSRDGLEMNVNYDYLIGCDGAHSTIRYNLIRRPFFNFSQKYVDHGYVELSIPAKRCLKGNMTPNHLHIWPRVTFMMIALPNADGSWTVTLFMPFQQFSQIKDRYDLLNFFRENFTDALSLIGEQNLTDTYFNTKPQPLVSIKCDSYTADSTDCLIIGDAAHAIVPFFGQGMNAGFEDCEILHEILKTQNLNDAFKTFSKSRVIDTHAISDLSMYNYLEMRNLVVSKRFLLRKKLDNILYKYLWRDFWKPLYVYVTFTSTPYSQCFNIQLMQCRVLKRLAIVSSALLCLLLLQICFIAFV